MSDIAFDNPLAFAGFMLAHAVWSIDETDEVLTTIHATLDAEGAPSMARIEAETIPEAVDAGRGRMADFADGRAAVLIYDGYAPVDGERMDALIAELEDFREPEKSLMITLAYRRGPGNLIEIIREEFLSGTGAQPSEPDLREFSDGIARHEEAAPIWHRGRD